MFDVVEAEEMSKPKPSSGRQWIKNWPESERPREKLSRLGPEVPFDLSTFRYVQIKQAAEIPTIIKAEIIAILREAGAPL